MQINIGKNIRELRRRDGRTQEDLANALGVSGQAISRWEANGGYPDMETVPAIANYFHVTIDELFGYHGDREAQIQAIADKAKAAIGALGGFLGQGLGDLTETVEMLRKGLEEFPNEPELMILLADALLYLGWQKHGVKGAFKEDEEYYQYNVEDNAKNSYWQESLQMYEKLLSMDDAAKYREVSIMMMIHLCYNMGMYNKAKKLAEEQPSIIYCNEILLTRAKVGEEADKYRGELILKLLNKLYGAVDNSVQTRQSVASSLYGREVLLALIRMFETVFTDNRCGREHFDLRGLYLTMAKLEARHDGDMEKALAYFDKGFEHHKEYCRISEAGEYHYSAPLVEKVTLQAGQFQEIPENFWEIQMPQFTEEFCEELKKNPKYSECFA